MVHWQAKLTWEGVPSSDTAAPGEEDRAAEEREEITAGADANMTLATAGGVSYLIGAFTLTTLER